MVAKPAIVYDVMPCGSREWRIRIDGVDGDVPFGDRESCVAAAMERARLHHVSTSRTTEVWAPGYGGVRDCLIRYMTPTDFDELLRRSAPGTQLTSAGYALGPLFPCAQW
jgi:hypothetical protein